MQISLSTVRVQIRCKPDHATAGIGDCGSIRKRENNILKNIIGLLSPVEGQIVFKESILLDTVENVNLAAHQRHIALIFQHALLFPHMNVLQNLHYAKNSQKQSIKNLALNI